RRRAPRRRTRRVQPGSRASQGRIPRGDRRRPAHLHPVHPRRRSDTTVTWQDHYLETLGNVPDAIEQLFDLDPEVGEAYTTIRRRAYTDKPGHLPLKFRELIFVVVDIELGNFGGAMNHLTAGVKAGLTRTEFADALVELLIVRGISAWGLTG